MHHQVGDAKQARALDLDRHRIDRLLPQGIIGTSHIDKIRCVSNRLDDPRLIQGFSKQGDMLGRYRRGVPLVVVLGKELDGLEADGLRGPNSTIKSAGDRHVSTKLASGISARITTLHCANHSSTRPYLCMAPDVRHLRTAVMRFYNETGTCQLREVAGV